MSRPITTGTGIRLSAYIPLSIWKRLDGRLQKLDGITVSAFVQEAISDYLAQWDELDAMDAYYTEHEVASIKEVEQHETQSKT